MPKPVYIPQIGREMDFPDEMSQDDIAAAIEKDVLPNREKFLPTHGSPQPKITGGDVASAVGHGVLRAFGVDVPKTPKEFLLQAAENLYLPAKIATDAVGSLQTAWRYINEARQAKSTAGAVTKAIGAVPVAGPIVSDVLQPAVAYSEGREPTRQENLSAIEAGTAGVTMGATALAAGAYARAKARAGGGTEAAPGSEIRDAPVEELEPPQPGAREITPAESLPPTTDSDFGAALRTVFTGERDVRVAEANNLRDDIRSIVKNPVDQEALTLMRDFKGSPEAMKGYLDGSAGAYADMKPEERVAAMERVDKLRPVIERALDPTPEMRQADELMDGYFKKMLDEGRELGFLDSGIDPEEYITHHLTPKEPRGVEATSSGLRMAKVSRSTPFAKGRFYRTVLDAVANGVEPKTLNAADSVSIYGDKHATAAATRTVINVLKDSDLAKFGTDSTVPKDWAEVGRGTRYFRNEVPYLDQEGNPQVAHQALYAPKDIAAALRPITDPDYTDSIPGFRASRLYQSYLKSVELGLSVFHMRALNLTSLANDGVTGLMKSYASEMDSPRFRDVETTFLRSGGTTSITGRTIEAYKAAGMSSIPTRIDAIRNLPVFKQFDQVAQATSRLTFDVLQRKFKVTSFAMQDAKWIAQHPEATPTELAGARRSIAKEINAAYGGLNWQALGVNKMTQSLTRAVFLAPDWTFSNWQNAKTAFSDGPGGARARAFWLRSAVAGVALTQLTSLMLSGEKSDDPTQVYLGKDRRGKSIYQNIFFAGAPSDLVTLTKNVQDFGPFTGLGKSVANKLSPFLRAGMQTVTNKNYLGQDIVPQGSGVVKGGARYVREMAGQVLPVPFSINNIVQMLTDKKREYTPQEYITTLLAGTRPRHVSPEAERRRRALAERQYQRQHRGVGKWPRLLWANVLQLLSSGSIPTAMRSDRFARHDTRLETFFKRSHYKSTGRKERLQA